MAGATERGCGGKPSRPAHTLVQRKELPARSLGIPGSSILTHFCQDGRNPAPIPAQTVGDKSACWWGGQAALCCLRLEREQSTLECCFWEAAPRSCGPLASADR